MLTWWLYSIVVAALIGVAALAAERALRLSGLATRWVWAVAMLASASIPVVVTLLPAEPTPEVVTTGASAAALVILPALTIAEAGTDWARWAVVGWLLVSGALFLTVLACALVLARRRRGWKVGELDGAPVLWSARTGPAVVGVRRPQIVVPCWAADLPAPLRRLLVAHEREHIVAKDPLLFHALLALVVALPWNVALWWQLLRLRAALELDCDARVLRAGADRRGYAELLLHAAERFAAAPVPALAFAWPGSLLKRRMRLLAPRRARFAKVQVMVASAVAVVLVVQACTERPAGERGAPTEFVAPEIPSADENGIDANPAFTPYTVAPELTNRSEIVAAMLRDYPELVRDAANIPNAQVWLLIDEQGRVLKSQIQRSSGRDDVDAAAVRIARDMQFTPALNNDRPVKVWIAVPLGFSTGGAPSGSEKRDPKSEPATSDIDVTDKPVFTPYTKAPELLNRSEVSSALIRNYPPLLREAGIGGSVLVWFLIDETGRVMKTQIQKSSGRDELDAAALRIAEEMQFAPALNRDNPVKVWVALPIVFNPGRARDESAPELLNADELAAAIQRNYPPLLRNAGIGGTVIVGFDFDDSGRVIKTEIQKSSGRQELDEAALRVAREITLTPARKPKMHASVQMIFKPN